jgi:hypothetical protein
MAEATGLHEAILFAQANQLKDTSIELDSAIIVNAIARKNFPRTNWGKSIRNSSRVLSKLNNVSVSWVSRDGNRAAHALARWALREPNRNWVSNYPSCILTHIQRKFLSPPPVTLPHPLGFPYYPLEKPSVNAYRRNCSVYPPRHTLYNVNFLGERVPRILKTSVNLYRGVCI